MKLSAKSKKTPATSVLLSVIIGTCLLTAGSARASDPVIDELTGLFPNSDRKAAELGPLYLETFKSLSRRLTSKVEIDRTTSRENLRDMIHHAGAPGNEEQAKSFTAAVTTLLEDKEYPAIGRHILIRGIGDIGGADGVPTLVALMGSSDPIEADLGRTGLQNIPGAESEKALTAALAAGSENPSVMLGLIDSIAARKSASAVAAIAPHLKSSHPEVVAAATTALGRLGGSPATKALTTARGGTTDQKVLGQIDLALLEIANQRAHGGKLQDAAKIFKVLSDRTGSKAVKSAAMLGLARTSPMTADPVIIAAVQSTDTRTRAAGISASALVPSRRLSKGLAAMLKTSEKPEQLQILETLARKGDLAVQPEVVEFLKSVEEDDRELEEAAIRALGPLGSVAVVELLLQKALSKYQSIREAAYESLGKLKGDEVARTIEFHAREGKTSEMRAIAVGMFMRNRNRSGLTRMMAFAAEDDSQVSNAAIAVLRREASDAEFRHLLDLLAAKKGSVISVIRSVCARAKNPDLVTGEIITYMRGTDSVHERRTLLGLLPMLGTSSGLSLLKESIGDGKATTDSALRALAKWPDPKALPVMLDLLKSNNKDKVCVNQMVKGITRLVESTPEAELELKIRVRYVTESFDLCSAARERMMLLGAMSNLPDSRVAEIVEEMLSDTYVSESAASAAGDLCGCLVETDPEAAKALAMKLQSGKFNSIVRRKAAAVLSQLEEKSKGDL